MRNRVILSKNGTLSDLSTSVKDYNAGSSVIDLTTDDYLYIGQMHPFNNLYFNVTVLNIISSIISIDIWDGSAWQDVVEITDETSAFSSAGLISWVPDRYKSWMYQDTVDSSGTELITGLGDVTIYDRYWIRMSVSVNITGTTAISWIGSLFCNDTDLTGEYPSLGLSSYKTSFAAGKADWREQIARASDVIIDDLVKRGTIIQPGQIIDIDSMRNMTVSKTAELIFNALGSDYEDDRLRAQLEYSRRIKKSIFNVDKNSNAILDKRETATREGYLSR